MVGSTSANNTVNLSSGGTFSVANGTNRRSLTIGGSTFGGNSVLMSTPGTLATPTFNLTGNSGQANIGVSSSSNSLTVNNGAYLSQSVGGGTNTWTLGTNAGANSNSILVSGTGSTINFGSNQATNVGGAGDSNSVTVSAAGLFSSRRWLIGANGGNSNSVTVTGTGSVITTSTTATASTNALFEIGTTVGSDGNYLSVAAGGAFNFYGSNNQRNFSIGRAGDNNYFEVTGSTSTMTINWAVGANNEVPLSVGGFVSGVSTVTEGGTGNHLDISSGGTMTSDTSLYVMGTDSAFNLGNGTSLSTATIGAATGGTSTYTSGVFLKNSSGRLNFDGGKLIAGANGNLVSGAGTIDLLGNATVSTTQTLSTISVVIEDSTSSGGSFTKEGTGTLDLTQINTYTGDTIVAANGGILKMENAYLANGAAVRLFTGGQLDLNTSGATDTIAALYFDGVLQAGGTWGGTGSGATNINTTFFAPNSGKLFVGVIPEPTAALLGGLGMLTLLRRRRLA